MVEDQAIKKAQKSSCRHKVVAVGFSKRGDYVGTCTNLPRFCKEGGSIHAEANLIRTYGKRIRDIYIMRVGRSGQLLPIEACENCSKIAEKNGIKIHSVCD